MIIGITGGIGTGKSTVLNILKDKFGFYVFETDKIAHEVMKRNTSAYNMIVNEFGKDILDEAGEIDRIKMGNIVFNNENDLKKLNDIVHPEVLREISERIEEQKNSGINNFVIESALLIESGCYKICDKVWYIYSENSIRIERLKTGRNMTEDRINAVIKNQLNYETFADKANAVIDNSFSIENTCSQIEKLLEF